MLLTDVVSKNIVVSQDELAADSALLRDVQVRLVVWGFYPHHQVDGKWGRLSEGALINFCNRVKLNSATSKKYGASFASALLGKPLDLITPAQAAAVFGRLPSASQMADLNSCLARFEINTPARIRCFISQISHETCGLRYLKELASGEAYEGRKDLGNIKRGWGRLYRGGGVLQTTGRYNYEKLYKEIGDPKILELGADYVAEHYPFTSGGVWWRDNHMNSLIDIGGTTEQITKRINGGRNGLEDRRKYYAIACKIIPG